jgi:hypothetical protein
LRRSFLFAAIMLMMTGPASAERPFVPPKIVPPDYVVTIGAYRKITHHGDWTRVDQGSLDRGTSVEYFSSNGIAISKASKGSLYLVRDKEPNDLRYEREPRNKGERRTYHGESCTGWDAWRTPSQRSHLSCVTDDGIELLQGDVYDKKDPIRSAGAIRIERRPVAPEEARPPRSILTVDWWDRDDPSSIPSTIPDHETVFELTSTSAKTKPEVLIRTVRTHGSWQFLEETVDGARNYLTINYPKMAVSYTRDKSGEHQNLAFTVYDPPLSKDPALTSAPQNPRQPRDLGRSEAILGESCRWFDMTNTEDAGTRACRADDGIVLKETRWVHTRSDKTWTAIRVARRPITIDEVRPPAELLSPQTWGIDW